MNLSQKKQEVLQILILNYFTVVPDCPSRHKDQYFGRMKLPSPKLGALINGSITRDWSIPA